MWLSWLKNGLQEIDALTFKHTFIVLQNGGRAQLKPKIPAWKDYAGSLMTELKQNLHCKLLDH